MRLFARRHRALVASVALVFGVTLVASVVSIGFAVRSNGAEGRAEAQTRRYRDLFETEFSASVETAYGRMLGPAAPKEK
jgi:hypothetical protein